MRQRILAGLPPQGRGPLFSAAVRLGLAFWLAGVTTAARAQTIKVGEYASLTGSEASFGQMSHHGTEMAVSNLNSRGGVLGRKLELLTEGGEGHNYNSWAIWAEPKVLR